jgi:pSer/pThr/pTyr-binding forkhead associated (FHA) protein
VAVHCPECGFVNDEGANYCQKCGAFLGTPEPPAEETTATYRVDEETGEIQPVQIEDVVADTGAALVIRSGGGRTGESFPLDTGRLAVGRRPESDIFLDDVTVSRDHAVIVRRGSDYYLDDLGSLNGTYVNRQRVDSRRLEDGDEVQIGKYKLSYLHK